MYRVFRYPPNSVPRVLKNKIILLKKSNNTQTQSYGLHKTKKMPIPKQFK